MARAAVLRQLPQLPLGLEEADLPSWGENPSAQMTVPKASSLPESTETGSIVANTFALLT